ncbi:MAG: glutaredoxin 3 [Chitinophagaceae bacterium]|nr:glutaredoxin 3 [Oligoflexus sp.]
MAEVKVYTGANCGYCSAAKKLLQTAGIPFQEIGLDDQPDLRQKLSEENGHYRTIPMIFVDGKFIGGFTDLQTLHKQGKLLG